MDEKIFFFDKSCGMCSGFVRLLHEYDRSGAIRFAPIGGETFQGAAKGSTSDPREESYFKDGQRVWRGEDAIIRSLAATSSWPKALAVLSMILPHAALRKAYRFIAERRRMISRILGAPVCRVPDENLRRKILP